jgi:NitT/TauT family transport system substrate-binding protein
MKKLVLVICLAAAVTLAGITLTSCGKPQPKLPAKPVSVPFAYQPFGSNLTFFVAVDRGFFKKRGIDIQPEKIISANDAANAVVTARVAGNATVPLNVLLNIEENEPGTMKILMVKATSSKQWSDYLLVKKGSKIKSVADLKGRKVGGYPGSAQQTILKLVLGKFMPEKDILTVELPPGTQLQALDSGQVAAMIAYDELAEAALSTGVAQVLEEDPIGKHIIDPLYGFPYVLSTQYAREHPGVARKLRDAMYEAADFIQTNDKEAREIMAKWVGTKPEIAAKVRLWNQVKAEDVDRKALQRLADIFYQNGVTKKRIDTSGLYLTEEDLR